MILKQTELTVTGISAHRDDDVAQCYGKSIGDNESPLHLRLIVPKGSVAVRDKLLLSVEKMEE